MDVACLWREARDIETMKLADQYQYVTEDGSGTAAFGGYDPIESVESATLDLQSPVSTEQETQLQSSATPEVKELSDS